MREEGKACVKRHREERESQIKEKKKAQSKTSRERERVARFERRRLTVIEPFASPSQL